MDQFYFEEGYIEQGYLVVIRESAANIAAVTNFSATVEIADTTSYYIPDYIEEGYYALPIQEGEAVLSSSFTKTVDATRIKTLEADFEALFSPSIVINATRAGEIGLFAAVDFAVNESRIRSNDAALNNIVTLSLQGDRTAGFAATQTANFDQNISVARIRSSEYTAAASFDQTAQPTRIKQLSADLGSLFSPNITPVASLNGSIDLHAITNKVAIAGYVARITETLESSFALAVEPGFVKDYSADLNTEFSQTARTISYQPVQRRNVVVDNYSFDSDFNTNVKKFGSASYKITEFVVSGHSAIFDGSNFKIFKGGETFTSSNGVDWTSQGSNLPSAGVARYDNGYYFANNYFSTDGVNWTEQVFDDDYYLFFGNSDWYAYHPTTAGYQIRRSLEINSIFNLDTVGSGSGNSGVGIGAKSANDAAFAITLDSDIVIHQYNSRVNWSVSAVIANEAVKDFIYGNSEWVVLAESGNIYTSTDLVNFSLQKTVSSLLVDNRPGTISYVNGEYWNVGYYRTYRGSTIAGLTEVDYRQFLTLQNSGNKMLYGNGVYLMLGSPTYQGNLTSSNSVDWDILMLNSPDVFRRSVLEVNNLDTPAEINDWRTMDFWAYNSPSQTQIIDSVVDRSLRVSATVLGGVQSYQIIVKTLSGFDAIDFPVSADVWNHIRIVQSNSNFAFYVNGTRRYFTNELDWPTTNRGIQLGKFALSSEYLYLDEFFVTYDLVNDPTNTSITVPTEPWTSTETTRALLHFDNSLQDDTALVFDSSANLNSTATQTVGITTDVSIAAQLQSSFTSTATATRIKSASATLNATFSQTAVFDAIRRVVWAQTARFDQNAVSTRFAGADTELTANSELNCNISVTRQGNGDFEAFYTQLSAVSKIGDFFVNADLVAAITTEPNTIADAEITVDSVSTVIVKADRTRSSNVNLNSTANITVQGDLVAGSVADFDSQFNQTVLNTRTRSSAAEFNSDFEIAADASGGFVGLLATELSTSAELVSTATRIKQLQSTVNSISTVIVNADKTVRSEVDLNSTANTTVQGDLVAGSVADFDSQFTETVLNTRTRSSAAEFNSDFEIAADASGGFIGLTETELSANSEIDTVPTRIKQFDSDLAADFTTAVFSDRIRSSEVELVTVSSITATASRILQSSVAFSAFNTQLTAVSKIADFFVNINSQFDFDATVQVFGEGELPLLAVFDQTVSAERTRSVDTVTATEFSLTVDADKTVEAEIDLDTSGGFAIDINANRQGDIDLNTEFVQTTAVNKITGYSAELTAIADQVTDTGVVKQFTVSIDSLFSPSIRAGINRVGSVDLSSQFGIAVTGRLIDTDRIVYRIPRESRILAITKEQRTYEIHRENRAYTIQGES